MVWTELLFALFIGIVLSLLLVGVLGRRGPGPLLGFMFFFLLLFLFTWAGGVWLVPAGPVAWGQFPWLSVLILGLIVALLLAAVTEPHRPRQLTPGEAAAEAEEVAVTFTAFFWILLGALVATIALAYFMRV